MRSALFVFLLLIAAQSFSAELSAPRGISPHDCSVSITDGATTATPGNTITYTITAHNVGAAVGATVIVNFQSVQKVKWTAVFTGNATGAASGQGSINEPVSLPGSSSVTYTATGTIAPQATGTLTNSITLSTVGDTNTANDSASDTDTLISPPAAFFSVAAPLSSAAGTSFDVIVMALGANNAPARDYTGTVHFTSSDPAAVLPANYAFTAGDGGTHTFTATLFAANSQTITATDTVTSSITGNRSIQIDPHHLRITAPASAITGSAIQVTVSAEDAANAVVAGYTGTVHFTSTDASASLPADYTFLPTDNGSRNFSIAFNTAGSATLTLSDTAASLTATSAAIQVNPPPPPPDPVAFTSAPSAAPNPAGVGQSVSFAAAAGGGSGTLTYTWNFGDGSAGVTGDSVSHVYTTFGTFGATVTVTDPSNNSISADLPVTVNAPVIGTGYDIDADGFSDSVESATGSDPNSAASTPTGAPIAGASTRTLTVSKAAIKLNFAKTGNDSIAFSGTLDIPAGFNPSGAKLLLNFGEVLKTFTLTAKGSGGTRTDSVKVSIKSKKGIVAAQTSKYTVSLKKGTFAATLATVGFANETTKSSPVPVKITLVFDGCVLTKLQMMSYTATAGKSGAAKSHLSIRAERDRRSANRQSAHIWEHE